MGRTTTLTHRERKRDKLSVVVACCGRANSPQNFKFIRLSGQGADVPCDQVYRTYIVTVSFWLLSKFPLKHPPPCHARFALEGPLGGDHQTREEEILNDVPVLIFVPVFCVGESGVGFPVKFLEEQRKKP